VSIHFSLRRHVTDDLLTFPSQIIDEWTIFAVFAIEESAFVVRNAVSSMNIFVKVHDLFATIVAISKTTAS